MSRIGKLRSGEAVYTSDPVDVGESSERPAAAGGRN